MRFTLFLCLALGHMLAACAEFPELDAATPAAQGQGGFPELRPLAPLLMQAESRDSGANLGDTARLQRIANLRARATGLRGPVIPPPLRARMLRGVR